MLLRPPVPCGVLPLDELLELDDLLDEDDRDRLLQTRSDYFSAGLPAEQSRLLAAFWRANKQPADLKLQEGMDEDAGHAVTDEPY